MEQVQSIVWVQRKKKAPGVCWSRPVSTCESQLQTNFSGIL